MASFVEDSLGWHDTLSGYTSCEATDVKYGKTQYQELRNDWLRSGQENFAVELVRSGLGVRDLVPAVNLFSKVYCADNGDMHFSEKHCQAGATITLRTEMDTLLILSNTPLAPLDFYGPFAEEYRMAWEVVTAKVKELNLPVEYIDFGFFC